MASVRSSMVVAGVVGTAALDVIHPSGERTRIPIEPLPFRIGRGPDNHLVLRDNRASRAHAWITHDGASLAIEDLDSLHGTWVNGRQIEKPTPLKSGDTVHFGFEDSYRLVFSDGDARISRILDRISTASSQAAGAAGSFARLRALVEVARTLQTSLAGDEVLNAVVDAALALTGAERGFLLLRSGDELQTKIGRDHHGTALDGSALDISADLMERALTERHDMLSIQIPPAGDEDSAGPRQFSDVICVPLVQFRGLNAEETMSLSSQTNTVGLLYLDSRTEQRPLSELNRELLHTLALEASTVLEDAKLLEEERQKLVLKQELEFARKVQQSLLPREFPASGWLRAAGSSLPFSEIGGDYFDLHPIGTDKWAAVIADVSGKGASSALLASLLQGAFLLGSELEAPLDAVLAKMNRFLIDRAQREKYATLFYARIDRAGETQCVNAGHCAPLLLRHSGEVQMLATSGAPIGLLPDPKFEVNRLQLAPGDKIVAYSDGLAETQNSRNELFEDKLGSSLAELAALDAQQIHDRIMQAAEAFREGEPLRDDATLLVLEYHGEA
ncbi:MAG: SpoIIE family protein phosphatase [Acidobacteriaceae bacterium]|nr:SpoIIE family protein phosphatase [Acidobacteriaceae bacterium]